MLKLGLFLDLEVLRTERLGEVCSVLCGGKEIPSHHATVHHLYQYTEMVT